MSQVSILTTTQFNRFECLKILYNIIQRQNYVQIKEWVIVEGSQNREQHDKNLENIKGFINEKMESTDIEMRLIETNMILPLSNLRNIGNDNCKGDIIVCMDDDDYYPSSRVSHAVKMLNQDSRLIAGCTKMYLYDFLEDKLYKFFGYHNNHSTNNCLAYKKEYLKNHRYKEGLSYAEESSFTNDFSEPMIQLNSDDCIVVSRHEFNTIDKKSCLNDDNVYEINSKIKTVYNIIPKEIFDRMKECFNPLLGIS